jgi:hypothetical protein
VYDVLAREYADVAESHRAQVVGKQCRS